MTKMIITFKSDSSLSLVLPINLTYNIIECEINFEAKHSPTASEIKASLKNFYTNLMKTWCPEIGSIVISNASEQQEAFAKEIIKTLYSTGKVHDKAKIHNGQMTEPTIQVVKSHKRKTLDTVKPKQTLKKNVTNISTGFTKLDTLIETNLIETSVASIDESKDNEDNLPFIKKGKNELKNNPFSLFSNFSETNAQLLELANNGATTFTEDKALSFINDDLSIEQYKTLNIADNNSTVAIENALNLPSINSDIEDNDLSEFFITRTLPPPFKNNVNSFVTFQISDTISDRSTPDSNSSPILNYDTEKTDEELDAEDQFVKSVLKF